MIAPQHISIADYDYPLPADRIAYHPLSDRDASRLLIYQSGEITEDIYRNIADHLPKNSLLVFNNTRVVEARILFQKPTGGVIEIFCLEPDDRYADMTIALQQKHQVYWKCLVGGASKWKPGMILKKQLPKSLSPSDLSARYIEKQKDYFIIELSWEDPHLSFAELLHLAGAIPLPPYIKRKPDTADLDRYQTIYASEEGSVAAPTAGLHFTDQVFARLKARDIHSEFLTLHVGAGTFKPVSAEKMEDHDMHAESIQVSAAFVHRLLHHFPKPVTAVGTTSFRSLESLYWLGVKTIDTPDVAPDRLFLDQWEAYEWEPKAVAVPEALSALSEWMKRNNLNEWVTKTRLMAAPGYRARVTDILVTNFHQPRSTLLLLVAALLGEDWKKTYAYALDNGFRFLSYGDGNLLWIRKD